MSEKARRRVVSQLQRLIGAVVKDTDDAIAEQMDLAEVRIQPGQQPSVKHRDFAFSGGQEKERYEGLCSFARYFVKDISGNSVIVGSRKY